MLKAARLKIAKTLIQARRALTRRAPPSSTDDDADYEAWASWQVRRWQSAVLKPPSKLNRRAKDLQVRFNEIIPERVHGAITAVMSGMMRTILTGVNLTNAAPLKDASLAERDRRALELIDGYRATAAAEGGVTGAGGFWLALADFPALITIKIKLLFDLAAVYGHDAEQFEERLYILGLFQLAFSGAEHRARVFHTIENWEMRAHPADFAHFDWRAFQQEYRDYIDLAKLGQMIPVVGAPIGAVVNWQLLERLGDTAINGYRMRWLARSAEI